MLISFHSLEDRLVKDSFREGAKAGCVGDFDEEAGDGERARGAEKSEVEKCEVASSGKRFRDRAGVVLPCFQAKDNQCTKKSLPPSATPARVALVRDEAGEGTKIDELSGGARWRRWR